MNAALASPRTSLLTRPHTHRHPQPTTMGVSPTTPTTLAAATDDLTATLAVTKLDSMPPAAAAPSAISATLGGVPGVPFAPQSGALGSRTTLPESESKPSPFSLWKFIKDAAGEKRYKETTSEKRPAGRS